MNGNNLKRMIEKIERIPPDTRTQEERKLYNLKQRAIEAARVIAKEFKINSNRIANIWSLSQIYQILEKDLNRYMSALNLTIRQVPKKFAVY